MAETDQLSYRESKTELPVYRCCTDVFGGFRCKLLKIKFGSISTCHRAFHSRRMDVLDVMHRLAWRQREHPWKYLPSCAPCYADSKPTPQ